MDFYKNCQNNGESKLYFSSPISVFPIKIKNPSIFVKIHGLPDMKKPLTITCNGTENGNQIIETAWKTQTQKSVDPRLFLLRTGNKEEYLDEITPLKQFEYVVQCLTDQRDIELYMINKSDLNIEAANKGEEIISESQEAITEITFEDLDSEYDKYQEKQDVKETFFITLVQVS